MENSNNKYRQFWQQDNHPIYVESEHVIQQKLDYLHENPVRAGFVRRPEDWIYSSAVDYYAGASRIAGRKQQPLVEIVHI